MNKKFIEQMKAQRAMVKRNIEEIYSAMCVVLHKRGFSDDDIAEVVMEVQHTWEEVAQSNENMCDICARLTGIDIREV